jgi:hypothetical protein
VSAEGVVFRRKVTRSAAIGSLFGSALLDLQEATARARMLLSLVWHVVATGDLDGGPNGAQLAAGIVFQNSVTNAIAVWEHPTQVGRGLDGKAVDTRDSLCGLRRMDRARASASPVVQQLFVSEPFNNTIAVINLVVVNGPTGSVSRISSPSLNLPVDLAAVQRDTDNPNWVSNTTLDDGSDFYVANRGNNTIVRMQQDGTVVAVRRVSVGNNARAALLRQLNRRENAVIGIVAPHHRSQMGLLVGNGPMPVDPTPGRHRRQRSGVTVLRRYLSHRKVDVFLAVGNERALRAALLAAEGTRVT